MRAVCSISFPIFFREISVVFVSVRFHQISNKLVMVDMSVPAVSLRLRFRITRHVELGQRAWYG